MRRWLPIFLSVFALGSLRAAERFGDPVGLFAETYVPVMKGFEKTVIKTTWRGFILRADSSANILSDVPSKYGISLNVGVGDAERKAVDKTERNGDYTRRLIQIAAPAHEELSLVIEFCHGTEASPKLVEAIEKRCEELKGK